MKNAECSNVEEWLALRKEAALKIDPATAEVDWQYGFTLDPYNVCPDLPEELRQVGRVYFARSPGSDIWVAFHDLSEEVFHALWKRPNGGWDGDRDRDVEVPF
jgi:hypothetical protein